MIIAVDFDGTIVEHRYPEIGKELPMATATLRQLIKDGHKLILWSVREGKLLQDAVDWCEERGIRFYAVNKDIDEDAAERQDKDFFSRKLKAHVFIDDRNVGGLPDWGTIYEIISRRTTYAHLLEHRLAQRSGNEEDSKSKKKGWWPF